MKKLLTFLLMILLTSCSISDHFHKKNHRDNKGLRQGLWISYWDEANSIPMSKAWFKDDKEYKSKEYHLNGKLRLKMKWKVDGIIKVKYYDTLRRIEQKGISRIEFNDADIHYYYDGWWKFYNSKHKVISKKLFIKGELVEEISSPDSLQ